jgi:beta-N-acetylhexosaminidase
MAIGATFSPTSALRAATVTGHQLRAMGINEDDAPVVDVNTNPANTADGPRSFGDRAGMVSAMADAAVSGYQSAGVAATAKHFPGLGSTTINTDLLLMPDSLPDSVQAVLDAVQAGTISEQRIDESVTRILSLKDRLGLFTDPYPTNHAVGTPGQLATMASIAQSSMTLVKNDDGVLPLADGSGKHLLVTGWGFSSTQTLAADIARHGVTTQRVYTGPSPSAAAIAAAVAAAQQNDLTVATTNNAWGDTGQQRLIKALVATGKPVVVVALGGPYDIAYFDEASTFLAAYGYQPNSLTAITNTLFGTNPTGRLPVTIPVADNPSQPLYLWGTGLSYRH